MLISDLITDLISNFGIASMLNHTINLNLVTKCLVWFNIEAIPKFDIKSVKKFDISIKPIRDHPFKTSGFLRGGGVKNLPNLPTDSSKKLPTVGG